MAEGPEQTRGGELASGVPVLLPIALHSFGHIPSSTTQPTLFSAPQVPQNVGDLAFASQVNIRGFRAHGIENRFFVALFGQVGNLNGIRSEEHTSELQS